MKTMPKNNPKYPKSSSGKVDAIRHCEPETSRPLADLDATFIRWLGVDYDLDAIHATLAAAAAIRLDGDPVWLLLVSGPGNAKTETVASLQGTGAYIVSTIASAGALLSATSKGERADEATGGLLKTIGEVGVLVLKDFTSIMSLAQSSRTEVLAALREIYDGKWVRTVGTDGGRTLGWTGRIALIGAVTTEWDRAHTTVSAMGDRFVLLRMDSTLGRLSGGRRAIANTGSEVQMRHEFAQAVKSVIDAAGTIAAVLDDHEGETLLRAADLVTKARTAVYRDGQGNVTDAHAPEMPTRFAKQLTQIVRGGAAIGMGREGAMRLAIRCARDSIPPLRLVILRDVAMHGESLVADVRKRVDKPHNTIDRELTAMHMLGLVTLREETYVSGEKERTRWHYSISPGIDTSAVFPEKYVPPQPLEGPGASCPNGADLHGSTSIPGNEDTWYQDAANLERIARGKEVFDNGKYLARRKGTG